MTDCYCDYDPPEFFQRRLVKHARHRHKCEECSGIIAVGEPYECISGKWEGYFKVFKTCERCYDLRIWVKNSVPCFCPMHGGMDECMKEAIDDAWWRAPDETVGLRFGFLRRQVLRDRHNKRTTEDNNP